MHEERDQILIREAALQDTLVVGELIQQSLHSSPSSTLDEGVVPQEAFITGHDLLEAAVEGEEDLLIAEVDGEVAGIAQLKAKELVRSRHVGRLQLLVHPDVPFESVATALVKAALDVGLERELIKVIMDVSSPDERLRKLVERGEMWWTERVRPGALLWESTLVDVTTWACWVQGPPETAQSGLPRAE